MGIRTATGPNGEKLTFRSATNEAGETQWFQVDGPAQPSQAEEGFKPDIKQNVSMPAGLNPHMFPASAVSNRNKQIDEHNQYERSFIGDEERQRIKAEESERGFLSGIGKGIEHVIDDFNAGTSNVSFLPDWMNYKIGGSDEFNNADYEGRQKIIGDEMNKRDELYSIIRGENPLSTTIGETIPYLATGSAGERALVKLGSKVSPLVKEASIGANRALGNTVEANRLASMPKKFSSDLVNTSNAIVRGGVTGAAEGAASYDQSALEGATFSTLGGAMSHMGILSPLKKVRSERDKAGKEIIDEMYENGFQITPGVRSGNRTLQVEEAAMANSARFGQDYYNAVTRPNERRMTDMAGEAIGLDTKNRDMLSQTELAGHMDNLSNQYKQLEADTVGKISLDSKRAIGQVLKDAQPVKNRNQSKAAKARYETLVDASNEINTVLQPFTDRNGKFAVQRFDGARYQDATQYLNDQISKAYNDGDKILAKSLKRIKTELDKSIESGMGKTKAKEWRDLNERYAMSRMLMENGLTPSGKVDPTRLTSAVMNNDEAVRTLTKKGGRIRKFQDIARYNDVLRNVEGGDLTGLGTADKQHNRGLFTRASDLLMSPLDAAKLGYKTNTLTYPFIGRKLSPVHGLSTEALTNLGRSVAQTETPADLVDSAADNAKSGYERLMKIINGE